MLLILRITLGMHNSYCIMHTAMERSVGVTVLVSLCKMKILFRIFVNTYWTLKTLFSIKQNKTCKTVNLLHFDLIAPDSNIT